MSGDGVSRTQKSNSPFDRIDDVVVLHGDVRSSKISRHSLPKGTHFKSLYLHVGRPVESNQNTIDMRIRRMKVGVTDQLSVVDADQPNVSAAC